MTSSVITEAPERVRGLLLDEYHALVDSGLLHDAHVELLEGEIVEMVPSGAEHASTVTSFRLRT